MYCGVQRRSWPARKEHEADRLEQGRAEQEGPICSGTGTILQVLMCLPLYRS
ncbi:hypothetical protein PM8797T_31468 [Gimesia maris DSM 8797]|nr:hypothetical protein PM8797T_31468 [Gimesia maris DSM 8797]